MAAAYYFVWKSSNLPANMAAESLAKQMAGEVQKRVSGNVPAGHHYDAERPFHEDWWLLEVVESPEHYTAFRRDIVAAAAASIGVKPPPIPEPLTVAHETGPGGGAG